MIELKEAFTIPEFEIIESLAREILHEVYDPIIAPEHTDYFIEIYQTAEIIKKQIEHEQFKYLHLLFQNKPVGYLGIQILVDKIILSKLYILKEFRGNKLGKLSLDYVDNLAKELGSSSIELIVNRENDATIQIYKNRGFLITDDLVHTFENGHSIEDYKMIKTLK